jgi:hypothetical protein
VPGTPPGKDNPTPTPGNPSGKCDVASASKANPETSTGPIGQGCELGGEIAAIYEPPNPDTYWRKPLSEYLQLGAIPDNKIETRILVHQAKGYLIHNSKLYRCSALGILQWCVPAEEGKALLLDIQEGVCGHNASSRSMVGKAFQQAFYCRRPLAT